MEQKQVLEILKELNANSEKRKFSQSYDLIINLKNLDLKKPEQQIDSAVVLHNSTGKKRKIAAIVGPEMLAQARGVCDKVLTIEDAANEFKEKRQIKKLANEYDFFIAQATIMPKIAMQFGKTFGPRGKMPNPKLGCVVPPQANLKQLYDRLQTTVVVKAKAQPVIQARVGSESMKVEEVADNIMTLYNGVVHLLPSEKNNIRSIYLKFTMGKPVRLDAVKE